MQSKIMNSTMRYGLVFGLLFSLNFIFSVLKNPFLGILTYVIVAAILYLSYRFAIQYRDRECNGVISYRHALLFIVLLFFFASLISALVKYVYLMYINPDFLPNMMEQSMAVMEQIMPSVAEEARNNMEDTLTPFNYTMGMTWMNIFAGLVIGLIIAGIVKKDKNIFDNHQNVQQ